MLKFSEKTSLGFSKKDKNKCPFFIFPQRLSLKQLLKIRVLPLCCQMRFFRKIVVTDKNKYIMRKRI